MDFDLKGLAASAVAQTTVLATTYVPQVLLALVTLVIGLWAVRVATNMLGKLLGRRGIDPTVGNFLRSLMSWTLKVVLFISVASMVGIKTTSFVAILGAAGLAVGLALQGSLSNFAGGVLILIFRPYKVGDLIEAQGHLGVVKEIQIFTTTLLSPQNQMIIVPNGPMANGVIKNYTGAGMLRVDLNVHIAAGADLAAAKSLLLETLSKDPRVLTNPAPTVAVEALEPGAVKLAVRPYCTPDNYWNVYFDTLEAAKQILEQNNIAAPRRDLHLFNH
ncbi:MAG: mechanosensitive ion channel [Deltaproteobacteria bacterium]|nr:mechanosensitive ion channel [Deltaproteobacteria bacterium]